MPKETFYNLPPEKRQMITDIAIDEFAEHPYQAASISRIVANAGIAKGSFYQYFDDKKDLYLHLVDLFIQEKGDFARNTPPPTGEAGIFEWMRYLGRAGMNFEFSNPKLARISYRALYEDVPLPEESLKVVRDGTLTFFTELIEKGMQSGELDSDVDPTAAAFIMNTVVLGLGKFIIDQMDIGIEQIFSNERNPLDTPEGENLYDAVLYILEHGMVNKSDNDEI